MIARGNGARAVLPIAWAAILIGVAVSVAASIGVATRWLILGSFDGRWVYSYARPFTSRSLLVFVVVAAAAAAVLRITRPHPESRRRDWTLILVWIAVALACQAVLRSVTPATLETLFVSDAANSFFGFSQQHEAGEVLSRFNRLRMQAPLHAQSNMPGKVMLVYALRVLTSRADVLPWLLVIVSNLGAFLIYLFVRDLFDDRRAALYSAVLYLFVPAKLLFFPLMNTVTPVFVLGCACVLIRWLDTGRTGWAVGLGACLYALVFFEPLPLVMGPLFAALALRAIALGQISWARFAAQAGIVVLTCVGVSEAMRLATGFDLVRTFEQIRDHAVRFNEVARRPYGVWVVANLEEFLFGIGACQAVAFAGALAIGLGGAGTLRHRLTTPITTLCLGLLAVLIAVDLIGLNRGEVIRLWIFLACLFQIPAAYLCSRVNGAGAIALVVAASTLQVALGTAMIRFVVP
jgi:hypothetical protein